MFYTVRPGDSPAKIARKLTGNPAAASQLVAANPQIPRVASGGVLTFASLRVGQRLAIPPSWNRFSDGAVYGVPVGIGDASSIGVEMQALNSAAAAGPSADSDGSYHGSVVAYQTAGSVAASQLGPDIDNTYGAANTSSNTSLATATNYTLQAVNNGDATSSTPASLNDAQTAQNYLSTMVSQYNAAILAGKAANPGGGGGGGGGGGAPNLTTLAQTAASAISADANACTNVAKTGTAVNTAVHNFKVAWNAAGQKPALPYNGQYDQTTQAAIISLGVVAPAACSAPTPPAGCASGQVKDSVTGACVAPCSDGSTPANGVCPVSPPVPAPAAQASSSAIIAGVLIAGLGVGAVTYAIKKRKH